MMNGNSKKDSTSQLASKGQMAMPMAKPIVVMEICRASPPPRAKSGDKKSLLEQTAVGKNRNPNGLSKAHDPPATMKFMPEQPKTRAIQPIPPTTLPCSDKHRIVYSVRISNNCVNIFPYITFNPLK